MVQGERTVVVAQSAQGLRTVAQASLECQSQQTAVDNPCTINEVLHGQRGPGPEVEVRDAGQGVETPLEGWNMQENLCEHFGRWAGRVRVASQRMMRTTRMRVMKLQEHVEEPGFISTRRIDQIFGISRRDPQIVGWQHIPRRCLCSIDNILSLSNTGTDAAFPELRATRAMKPQTSGLVPVCESAHRHKVAEHLG